jgi:branched-chain amino acid transport system substrate-binding protein
VVFYGRKKKLASKPKFLEGGRKMKIGNIIIILSVVMLFFMGSAFGQAPIKIGFIGAMTGGSAVLGQRCSEGFKMFWDEYNEKGGVKGRKVELIIDDDEAQPAKAISAANKQITKDEIICSFATTNTPTAMAVVPVFQQYETPHLTQVFGPGVTKMGSQFVFRVSPTVDVYSDTLYEWGVKAIGLKSVAIISDKGAYGKDVGDSWEKTAPKYGVKIVTRETINLEDKDFTGQILKIKGLNPQMVIFAVNWELTMGLIAKNMRKLGLETPILTGALDVDKFVEYGEKATEGTIVGLPFAGFDQPKERVDFARRFKAKYGKDPVVHSVWGYDAGNLIALSLEKASPNINRTNVFKVISSISGLQLLQGVYDFKKSQDGISRSEIIKLIGGKKVLVQ